MMDIFVAVLMLCTADGGDCQWLHSPEGFAHEEQCAAFVDATVKEAKSVGLEASFICVEVRQPRRKS